MRISSTLISGAVAAVAVAGSAMGGVWTAYNDFSTAQNGGIGLTTTTAATTDGNGLPVNVGWSGNPLAARVTNYTSQVNTPPSTGGTLIDYGTGNTLTATVTLTSNNVQNISYSNSNQGNIGSDANTRFGGIVNLVGSASYSSTGAWYQQITFTNLDPTAEYSFFGHGNRGQSGTRTCFVELLGADASTGAASNGIYATISSTKYEYNTRDNNAGLLVGWTGIKSGSDGSFTIYVSNGSVSGTTAYGLGAFELSAVPAPGAIALLGAAGMIASRRRKA